MLACERSSSRLQTNIARFSWAGAASDSTPRPVRRAEVLRRRKRRERIRASGESCEAVELYKKVAVTREHEGDIEALADGVELSLLQTMSRREVLRLCLNQGDGYGLRARIH